MDKKSWWAQLKATIGMGIKPEPQKLLPPPPKFLALPAPKVDYTVAVRMERRATRWKHFERRAEFFIGQTVRRKSGATNNPPSGTVGTVTAIVDLSHAIDKDDPKGTRDFILYVKTGVSKAPYKMNAGSWEPV